MHDHPDSNKYASADKPINRRTRVPPESNSETELNPVVMARLKAAKAKQVLGSTLQARTHHKENASASTRDFNSALVVPTVLITVASIGIFLGAINGSAMLSGAGGLGLLIATAWGYSVKRKATRKGGGEALVALVSNEDLDKLDARFAQLVSVGNDATVQLTCQLKETIARSLALAVQTEVQMLSRPEDKLFLREAVRRYIPDSINAWLQIPAEDRDAMVLESGETSSHMLIGQLTSISEALLQIEKRYSLVSSEPLLQQQRFLDAKTRAAP